MLVWVLQSICQGDDVDGEDDEDKDGYAVMRDEDEDGTDEEKG